MTHSSEVSADRSQRAMNATCIMPGQPISLTTDSAFHRNTYDSRVISLDSKNLAIATPTLKGLKVPLNVGFVVHLSIETADGSCRFTTEVLAGDTGRHALVLRLPADCQMLPNSSPAAARCRFIAVTSGKGGVGKTSFVINYAIALAERGRKVLLFDADLGMANVDVLMKTSSRSSIVDVIEGYRSMHEVITPTAYGIDIIAGGSGMATLGALAPAQMQRITLGFKWLESHYDYVLIDTGAGLSKNVTSFVFAVDKTIVVTTPEPHAITDAYSIIKVILEESRDVKLKLLINKCESNSEGIDVMKRVSRVIRNFLDYTVTPIGCMPESRSVSRSIREQVPLMASHPNSDVAKCLRGIAETETLSDAVSRLEDAETEKRPTGESFVGRFMRRFKMA